MRRHLALVGLAVVLTVAAGPSDTVRVDNWDSYQLGPLDLSTVWGVYPPSAVRTVFKHPPSIAEDRGRLVLQLMTDRESIHIGRALKGVDVRKTPWLVWEWKALVLPDGGDVRDRLRNDQVGRVMLVFGLTNAILYVWDTTAPVGTETRSDDLDLFQRVVIVVRSGAPGVGQWDRQRRNVYQDYRRLFAAEPKPIKWVGLESHSDDTKTRSAILFGPIHLDAR